jgi:hypothetical protein
VIHIGGLRYQPARPPVATTTAPLDAAGPVLDGKGSPAAGAAPGATADGSAAEAGG